MSEIKLKIAVQNTHPQCYEMLIDDIENHHMIVCDYTETQVVLNALKYCLCLAQEEHNRKMVRKNYERQFGKDWH